MPHKNIPCQIPKTLVSELEGAGGGGVYCLKFSRCGRHLAMACPTPAPASSSSSFQGGGSSSSSAIFVYDSSSFGRDAMRPAPLMTIGGHSGPVYELDWSDHRTLLSASGDGTAQVWRLGRDRREVLEHPAFVYCARFHPGAGAEVVVTGGYDRVIRVWRWGEEEQRYTTQQVSEDKCQK